MGRGPQVIGPIRTWVIERIDENWEPYRIHGDLAAKFPGKRIPSLRWVQKLARERRPTQPSPTAELEREKPWHLVDATPEEASVILDVLSAAIGLSGTATISREHAQWLLRIRAAVPLMPPVVVWRFSLEYLATQTDSAHLDASLAVARRVRPMPSGVLGLDDDEVRRHVTVHVGGGWLSRPLVVWAGTPDTADRYVYWCGKHGNLIKQGDGDEWSWYDNDGFARLIFETGKGALS